MIEVQKLCKRFRKFTAVDDVSFTACDGEILGLLGANGAGKTTTLRIISATMRPSSGTVCIGGFDVVHQPDRARSILGVMPENWGFTAILRRATTCAFLVACTRWILPGSNSGSTR